MTFEEKIESLVRETIENMGYELVKVKIGREQGKPAIIIKINKLGGVSVEDCAKVSRAIDPIIEEADLMKKSYILIVSSPGV